jgi:hypothetical protein
VVQKEPHNKHVMAELSQELLLNLHANHGEEDNVGVELGSDANIELASMEKGKEEIPWVEVEWLDAKLGRVDYESNIEVDLE